MGFQGSQAVPVPGTVPPQGTWKRTTRVSSAQKPFEPVTSCFTGTAVATNVCAVPTVATLKPLLVPDDRTTSIKHAAVDDPVHGTPAPPRHPKSVAYPSP